VRFGSKQAADDFRRADPFDRLEIKQKTEALRARLRSRRYHIDNLDFKVKHLEDLDTRGLVAELLLPVRVRGEKPFYEDHPSFTGSLAGMHPSELDASRYAFVRRDGTLQICTPEEAVFVARSNGVSYHRKAPSRRWS